MGTRRMLSDIISYLHSRFFHGLAKSENLLTLESSCDHDNDSNVKSQWTCIIPTRDKPELLLACIQSINQNIGRNLVEIMVIDNRSSLPETARLLRKLRSDGVKVIEYPFRFNYSTMMNLAVAEAHTEFILFLNNDVKLDEKFRFEHLAQHLRMPGVGAASTILVDENLVPSHMGLKIGLKGIAASPSAILLNEYNGDRYKENHRCFVADASTFALTAVKRDQYLTIGGLDEKFKVGLNDVDFCIRLSKLGYKTEICVQSASMHIGSATRGPQYIPHRAVRTLYEIFLILRKHDVYRILNKSYLSSKKSAK